MTAGNLRVEPHLRHLYSYLVENRLIESVRDDDERCLAIFSRDVLKRIRSGDDAWEAMVPPTVAPLVKERGLLGYLKKAAWPQAFAPSSRAVGKRTCVPQPDRAGSGTVTTRPRGRPIPAR